MQTRNVGSALHSEVCLDAHHALPLWHVWYSEFIASEQPIHLVPRCPEPFKQSCLILAGAVMRFSSQCSLTYCSLNYPWSNFKGIWDRWTRGVCDPNHQPGRENQTLLRMLNHLPEVSFFLDSLGACSNEVSGLHASAKGVWGRNSGHTIPGRRAQNRPDCIPLSSFLMEPHRAWLCGLHQKIEEIWDLVPSQVMLIASHPLCSRLAASTAGFLWAKATGAAQAETSRN